MAISDEYKISLKEEVYSVDWKQAHAILYSNWFGPIGNVKAGDCNSNYNQLKRWHNESLELKILDCIAFKKPIKTRTTEFKPSNDSLYLLGQRIAKINPDTFEVTKICLPREITNRHDLNVFRLRLRQLGLDVRSYKGKTRIYNNDGSWSFLTPGVVHPIPSYYRKCCLPANLLAKIRPAPKDPVQLSLDLGQSPSVTTTIRTAPLQRLYDADNTYKYAFRYRGWEVSVLTERDLCHDRYLIRLRGRPAGSRGLLPDNTLYVDRALEQSYIRERVWPNIVVMQEMKDTMMRQIDELIAFSPTMQTEFITNPFSTLTGRIRSTEDD